MKDVNIIDPEKLRLTNLAKSLETAGAIGYQYRIHDRALKEWNFPSEEVFETFIKEYKYWEENMLLFLTELEASLHQQRKTAVGTNNAIHNEVVEAILQQIAVVADQIKNKHCVQITEHVGVLWERLKQFDQEVHESEVSTSINLNLGPDLPAEVRAVDDTYEGAGEIEVEVEKDPLKELGEIKKLPILLLNYLAKIRDQHRVLEICQLNQGKLPKGQTVSGYVTISIKYRAWIKSALSWFKHVKHEFKDAKTAQLVDQQIDLIKKSTEHNAPIQNTIGYYDGLRILVSMSRNNHHPLRLSNPRVFACQECNKTCNDLQNIEACQKETNVINAAERFTQKAPAPLPPNVIDASNRFKRDTPGPKIEKEAA